MAQTVPTVAVVDKMVGGPRRVNLAGVHSQPPLIRVLVPGRPLHIPRLEKPQPRILVGVERRPLFLHIRGTLQGRQLVGNLGEGSQTLGVDDQAARKPRAATQVEGAASIDPREPLAEVVGEGGEPGEARVAVVAVQMCEAVAVLDDVQEATAEQFLVRPSIMDFGPRASRAKKGEAGVVAPVAHDAPQALHGHGEQRVRLGGVDGAQDGEAPRAPAVVSVLRIRQEQRVERVERAGCIPVDVFRRREEVMEEVLGHRLKKGRRHPMVVRSEGYSAHSILYMADEAQNKQTLPQEVALVLRPI